MTEIKSLFNSDLAKGPEGIKPHEGTDSRKRPLVWLDYSWKLPEGNLEAYVPPNPKLQDRVSS